MQALQTYWRNVWNRLSPARPEGKPTLSSGGGDGEKTPTPNPRPQFGNGAKFLLILFLAGILFAAVRTGGPPPGHDAPQDAAVFDASARGFGAFSSEEERYNYLVRKTEGDYSRLSRAIEEQAEINRSLVRAIEELKAGNRLLESKIDSFEKDVEEHIGRVVSRMEERIASAVSMPGDSVEWGDFPAQGRLRIINVPPSEHPEPYPPESEYVYLPAGSFVKATLLTGAYAPVDRQNPLPVLLSIDEGFYGPGMSRVPLKGMLAIGKAIADVNSERSVIQLVDISWVGPDGQVFEASGNLGWVAGEDGTLGIPGKLVRRTGKVLTGAFASGFLSGAAEAMSYAETEPERRGRAVTGDVGRFAGYAGLSSAAATMSRHYAELLDQIVSAVQISMGESCYVIMSRGVEIEGLTPESVSAAGTFSGVD